MFRLGAVALVAAACGAAASAQVADSSDHGSRGAERGQAAPPAAGAVLVAHGGVLVAVACPGASGAACADRVTPGARVRAVAGGELPAGAKVASRCDEGRPGLSAGPLPDGVALSPPSLRGVVAGGAAATEAERARIAEQLARTDPTSASVPVEVRRVARGDLDGDGKEDAAFAVHRGELEALLVASSSSPVRLRIVQFADGEPIELLALVDVDAARVGQELVIRVDQGTAVSYEVVRDTGELVGKARCLTSR